MKRKIIIVTDGDSIAKKAVEIAAQNIGGRSISLSSGNPTPLTGEEIVELVKQAPHDPVVVMVDDCGNPGRGWGEEVLGRIAKHPDIEVLGVIAVASNTSDGEGTQVDFSINKDGKIVMNAVDKDGIEKSDKVVVGDTLSILKELSFPVIVGLGDPGKMNNCDLVEKGAPITTQAFKEIIKKANTPNIQ